MRKQKALIDLLRGLVDLLADESERSPEFATKLNDLLADLPRRRKSMRKPKVKTQPTEEIPDIYAEWNARGVTDFRLWLHEQPIPVLRSIIRAQDLDAARRTTKWKESEKIADFITDTLRARLARGSAFMTKGNHKN